MSDSALQAGPASSAPLDLGELWASEVRPQPYPHLVVGNLLSDGTAERLDQAFPTISMSGFVTLEDRAISPAFHQLDLALKGDDLTEALSSKFGRDMHPYPRLVTVRRWSRAGEGKIHTDSERKVMTLLLYLNETWPQGAGGQIRVLHDGRRFEPYALEVPPLMGRAFAFVRSDHSWHGHLPYVGERRVVQVTWLRDEAAMERKRANNRFHQGLKRLFGKGDAGRPQPEGLSRHKG